MGGVTFKTWEEIPADYLEHLRMQVSEKRRPSRVAVELVGRFVAQAMNPKKGYCDESHNQIERRLHGVLSIEQIKAAFRVLIPGVYTRIMLPTRGGAGRPPRATRLAFASDLDSRLMVFRCGAQPTATASESMGDTASFEMGSEHCQSGTEDQSVGDAARSVGAMTQTSNSRSNMNIQYLVAPIDRSNRPPENKLLNVQSEQHSVHQVAAPRRRGETTLTEAMLELLEDAAASRDQTHTSSHLDAPLPF